MSTAVIPEAIAQLQRQLDEFAAPSRGGGSCPSRCGKRRSSWPANTVCIPLRLDYMGLKKRLGGVPRLRQKASSPAFVELIAGRPKV